MFEAFSSFISRTAPSMKAAAERQARGVRRRGVQGPSGAETAFEMLERQLDHAAGMLTRSLARSLLKRFVKASSVKERPAEGHLATSR
jgi:hypothetical protein